jgi:tetratricopeptide (TPR) repeat protein
VQRYTAGRSYLASLLTLLGAALAALPAAAQTLSASPSSAQSDLSPELLGDLAMARQQYQAAVEAYRQGPLDSAEIWNKLGLAYHHLFAMDEAKRDYQHALRLRHNYPEALNNLGAVYYAKKDFRKAQKLYQRSLRLNGHSAAVYSNLGTAYFAEHKFSDGLAAYRTAFALDPRVFEDSLPQLVSESLPAHERAQQDYCLAQLFAQAGHTDRALDFLRRALNEGFDDRKKLLEDDTLASVRAMPAFTQLMSEQGQPR